MCRVRAHMLASAWHAVLLPNLEHMKAAGLELSDHIMSELYDQNRKSKFIEKGEGQVCLNLCFKC